MGKWKYEKGRCAARVQSFRGFKGFKGFKGLWYRPLGDEFICRLSAAKTKQPRFIGRAIHRKVLLCAG